MSKLIDVKAVSDIPEMYRNTPLGLLLEYHNLNRTFDSYASAQLLIGMCMDNRKYIHIPENFSFIIRSGGANLRTSTFKISYAISVGGIRHIALIGHDHCGMVNLMSRKEQFIEGMVEGAGWNRERAEEHFLQWAPIFEIENEIDFVKSEARRLQDRYPKIMIAPLIYKVKQNRLHLIKSK